MDTSRLEDSGAVLAAAVDKLGGLLATSNEQGAVSVWRSGSGRDELWQRVSTWQTETGSPELVSGRSRPLQGTVPADSDMLKRILSSRVWHHCLVVVRGLLHMQVAWAQPATGRILAVADTSGDQALATMPCFLIWQVYISSRSNWALLCLHQASQQLCQGA